MKSAIFPRMSNNPNQFQRNSAWKTQSLPVIHAIGSKWRRDEKTTFCLRETGFSERQ